MKEKISELLKMVLTLTVVLDLVSHIVSISSNRRKEEEEENLSRISFKEIKKVGPLISYFYRKTALDKYRYMNRLFCLKRCFDLSQT
jgi:hypothetical protein